MSMNFPDLESYDHSTTVTGPPPEPTAPGPRQPLNASQLRTEAEVIARINELEREAEELLSPAKTNELADQLMARVPAEDLKNNQRRIEIETKAMDTAQRMLNAQRSQLGSQISDLRIRARSLSAQTGSKDFDPVTHEPIFGTAAWKRINDDARAQEAFEGRGAAALARGRAETRANAALENSKLVTELTDQRARWGLELRANKQDTDAGFEAYDKAINEAKANALQNYRQYQAESRAYTDYYNKVLNAHRADVTQHGQDITRYLGEERLATSERNKDVDKIASFAEDMAKAAVKMAQKLVSPQQAAMMEKAIREYGKKAGIPGMANWKIGEPSIDSAPAADTTTAADFTAPGAENDPMFSGAPRQIEGTPRPTASANDPMSRARDYSQDIRFNPHLAYQEAARTAAASLDETRPGWRNRTINDPGPGPVAPNIPVPIYTEQPGSINVNAGAVASGAAAAAPSRQSLPTANLNTTTAEYEALMDALRREGLYEPSLDDGIGQAARDVLNGIGIDEPAQFTPSMAGG